VRALVAGVEDFDAVSHDLGVACHERQLFDARLRNEQAVERVLVVLGEFGAEDRVLDVDRDRAGIASSSSKERTLAEGSSSPPTRLGLHGAGLPFI
jgi:hypothetical protein